MTRLLPFVAELSESSAVGLNVGLPAVLVEVDVVPGILTLFHAFLEEYLLVVYGTVVSSDESESVSVGSRVWVDDVIERVAVDVPFVMGDELVLPEIKNWPL